MNVTLIVLMCTTASVPGQAAQPTMWAAPATTRIMPDTPPMDWGVELSAARNEWEAFQVVVTAGDEALKEVMVGPGIWEGGPHNFLQPIHLYREHYIRITAPSPQSDAQPGWYPDALVPLVPTATGYPILPAAPRQEQFAVPAGQNQPVWVDVYVRKDTPPGEYTGSIHVSALGPEGKRQQVGAVRYRLTVRPFTLPDRPSCKSSFGSLGAAAKWHEVAEGEETAALIRRYEEALIAHRLMPTSFHGAMPKAMPDGTIDATESHAVLKHLVEDLHVNCFSVPAFPYGDPLGANRDLTKTYLSNLYAYLAENGWEDMNYVYALDEPNDPEAYGEVRKRAALIHEANPNLRVMCTEQTLTSDPQWGDLLSAVDIWCPLWALHDPESAAERIAAGDELWSYTALCQGEKPTPWWQIDFPLLNYRVPLWQSWRGRMTGLLYWSTVHWDVEDPWRDPATTYQKYNGEGSLFYPGDDAGIQGPIASMRLKMIREGMEDYEYLQMLEDLRGREFVDKFVVELCRDWFTWKNNPAVLYELREQIAEAIEEAMR